MSVYPCPDTLPGHFLDGFHLTSVRFSGVSVPERDCHGVGRISFHMGGEVKNPKKNMPIALIGTVFVVTLLYVLLSVSATGLVDIESLAASEAPIAMAFSQIPMIGEHAGTVAAILAVIVVTGSLSSLIMFQARGEMKAAQEGY